jgi:hypothetical protein
MTRFLSLTVLVMVAVLVTCGAAMAQPEPTEPAPTAGGDEWATPDTMKTGGAADTAATGVLGSDPDKDREYKDRLREMEEDVVRLKEKIYKTKVRLNLLKERILSNVVAEAWAVITHNNRMSSAFALDQVLYYLDGKKLYFKRNTDDFLKGKFFTYLKGYKFKITSKYTFYTSRGRIVKLDVTGYEKGGPTYSLEEKPAIKFKVVQLPFNKENIARLTSGKE